MSNVFDLRPIHASFEQWELVANTAQLSADDHVRGELAMLALDQFRTSHLLINETMADINSLIASEMSDESKAHDQAAADRLIKLAFQRKSVVELSLSYPKPPEAQQAYEAGRTQQEVEADCAHITQAIEVLGTSLNHEERLLLKILLASPGAEITKREFIEAGFTDSDQGSIFTGSINLLFNKINASTSPYQIEKIAWGEGRRTRGYRLVTAL